MFGHPELPKPDSKEAVTLCELWDTSTARAKRYTAEHDYGVSYGGMSNWRLRCRRHNLPPTEVIKQDFTLHEHIERLLAVDELTLPHTRMPGELTVDIATTLPIAVPHMADMHQGEAGCDYRAIERDHNLVCTEPGVYNVLGGDAYSNIIMPGMIGSAHNQAPICVQKAMYYMEVEQQHDSGHMLFMGTGNHNYWSALATGEDWDIELARRINTVYTKHGAMVHIVVGEMVYDEFWEHKGKYESSFNQTHGPKQSQRVYHPRARIVVREHKHVAAIEQYRYDDRECVAIRPGTYVTYSDFAARNGMYGAHVCNPTVVLFPDRDWIVGFKFMEDAIIYLRSVRKDYEERGLGIASEHVRPIAR